MGKIHLTNKEQEIILDVVKQNDFIKENFYFTGGTALSSCYLNHRYSDDLDFFTQEKFENDVILGIVTQWSKDHQFTFTSRFVEVVYIFRLFFNNNNPLKVDFAYYPYQKIEKENIIDGIHVDSLIDIAVNKVFTISQRTDVKDFVDLYFLLQTFSLWDLMHGVKMKFRMEVEPIFLSADFLKVEDFETLPQMIKPLTLEELKAFFREKAKELGKQATE